MRVGEIVLAMGNPLGLTGTVTDGIVSATGRTVSEGQGSSTVLISAIQTSAPINPGNSGGALVSLSGQVIGIPTLAASDPQMGGAAVGIGFAIPSDTVTSIARQLVATGKVADSGRAALGITAETLADASGQPAGVGVVTAEPGGPAAHAGIRAGDIILAVDGKTTDSVTALQSVLAAVKPGDQVRVRLSRDGTQRTAIATVGALSLYKAVTAVLLNAVLYRRTSSIEPLKYFWDAMFELPMLILVSVLKSELAFDPEARRTPST